MLVTAPGADGGTINGVTAALKLAGAKVTGQVQLQPAFFDTSASTQNSLDALAQKVAPPTVILGSQPTQPPANPQIAGQQDAAQVLAAALVTKSSSDLPGTPDQRHPGRVRGAGIPAAEPGEPWRRRRPPSPS